MKFIVAHIKWIMLVSGVLTCTTAYGAIAPQAGLRSTFGEALQGPLAEIVVRNWAALITLIGAMLIYGAFHTPVRALAASSFSPPWCCRRAGAISTSRPG